MVNLDIMVVCCLITLTNISSEDNLRLRADIVVTLYLGGRWLWIETPGLFAETSKVAWFSTIKTFMFLLHWLCGRRRCWISSYADGFTGTFPFAWAKFRAGNVPIT